MSECCTAGPTDRLTWAMDVRMIRRGVTGSDSCHFRDCKALLITSLAHVLNFKQWCLHLPTVVCHLVVVVGLMHR